MYIVYLRSSFLLPTSSAHLEVCAPFVIQRGNFGVKSRGVGLQHPLHMRMNNETGNNIVRAACNKAVYTSTGGTYPICLYIAGFSNVRGSIIGHRKLARAHLPASQPGLLIRTRRHSRKEGGREHCDAK